MKTFTEAFAITSSREGPRGNTDDSMAAYAPTFAELTLENKLALYNTFAEVAKRHGCEVAILTIWMMGLACGIEMEKAE